MLSQEHNLKALFLQNSSAYIFCKSIIIPFLKPGLIYWTYTLVVAFWCAIIGAVLLQLFQVMVLVEVMS